jgi:putative membrane-bound dehydrogenase-like protein
MILRSAAVIALLAVGMSRTYAADGPLPPEEAAASIQLPAGFQATLFAAEPDVTQPMSITFDDRGRMWVVECRSYPKWLPADAKEGRDRILILEDTNDDGRFDRKTVFLDKGVNFSSIEYGFGGVFVTAVPRLLFIPDANGDDIPDGPAQVLLDGFDVKAVHNVVNGLVWGPDGWLYGCNGILSNSRIGKPGTADADRIPMNCGIWRYHPTRQEFEVVAHGTTNPWGLAFDERGEGFLTNCVIEHAFHVVPGARFKRMFGQDFNPRTFELMQTCADHIHWAGGTWEGSRNGTGKHGEAGGGHAHSGAMIYLGDQFPSEYRNCLFTLNIHGQRFNVDKLEPNASGYIARHQPDFAQSRDPWFRGVCVKQGIDGCVYYTDWSDTGECHNYDDATIQRENGRIFRIKHGDQLAKPDDLGKLPTTQLPLLLVASDQVRAGKARRILQERAAAGQLSDFERGAILALIDSPRITRTNARLQGLWTAHACGLLTEELKTTLLGDSDETVRGWAVRLELEDRQASPRMLTRLAELARSDTSPYVRLQLASGLQRLPLESRLEIARGLVAHSEDAADGNLVLMVWYGIEPLVARGDDDVLNLAMATRIPQLRQFIARHLGTGEVPRFTPVLRWLEETHESVETQRDVLAGLHSALEGRRDLKPNTAWMAIAPRLAMSSDAATRETSQRISLIQGSDTAFAYFTQIVKNETLSAPQRERALAALVATRRPAVADLLLDRLNDSALRGSAIRGLAGFDRNEAIPAILGRYSELNEAEKLDAISTLTAREQSAIALVSAVDAGSIDKRDLSEFDIRQLQRFKDAKLKGLVNKLFGAKPSSAERARLIAEMKEKILAVDADTTKAGRGRAIFQKNCASCHTLFGTGRQVGPDLTGAQRTDLDYVLINVMDPSALVGHAYRVTIVVLNDGRVISGIVKSEDESTIALDTATDRIVVAKQDIEERQQQPVSMMPEGLLGRLTVEQICDLVKYLASPDQVPEED